MKIAIIGSGNVGGTLGKRWASGGHQVVFGSREPSSQQIKTLLAEAGANATAASSLEAAQSSDVVLLSTPWPATQAVLATLGNLAGKVLIDATNPVLADFSGLEVGTTNSAGEKVAGWAPGARVVKAFNTVGNNVMANPKFGERSAVLLYCGDDGDAKATVKQLADELGFEPIDVGPLKQARLLEPFAMLWISMALQYGYGREIGFQFLRR